MLDYGIISTPKDENLAVRLAMLEKGVKQIPGKFVDTAGNVIGKHNGIAGYTMGQRKGVGMSLGAGIPLYVVAKDPKKNTVIMGADELLFKSSLKVKSVSFISGEIPAGEVSVTAKTRYNQKDIPATVVYNREDDTATVTFDNPQRAVTPGQFAVFYGGDNVFGGGIILC
jgi:tRNA-specific 2-thiouridylase